MPKITHNIESVTPAWAAQILDEMDKEIADEKFKQRKRTESRVNMYAADMAAGNWGLTGQGISFDENGHLLDGQHRLAAVVKSGKTVDMLVVRGLPPQQSSKVRTIDLFDTGKSRSLGAQLQINGHEYANHLSSCARMLSLFARGLVKKSPLSTSQGMQLISMFKNNFLVATDMLMLRHVAKNAHMKYIRAQIVVPVMLLHMVHPRKAQVFATELTEKVGLQHNSPILALDRFLERPKSFTGGTDWQIATFAAVCSAMYSHFHGEEVEMIRGNKEHVEWLMKVAAEQVHAVRRIVGGPTVAEQVKS